MAFNLLQKTQLNEVKAAKEEPKQDYKPDKAKSFLTSMSRGRDKAHGKK
jgi:hypothetical protein